MYKTLGMKLGDKMYKIVDMELRTFFIAEVQKGGYRLQSEQEPTITFFFSRRGGLDEKNTFISKIVGLTTLEEQLFANLLKVRKEIIQFRSKFLEINLSAEKELWNYDAEQVETESDTTKN